MNYVIKIFREIKTFLSHNKNNKKVRKTPHAKQRREYL